MDRWVVVVGTSLGGLDALSRVLAGLSRSFPWPIAVVQHRSPDDVAGMLPRILAAHSPLPVREVEDKDPLTGGTVHVAPPDYHLLVGRTELTLSTDPKIHFARPSIDVLFESAAAIHEAFVVGVVLTGSGIDGAAGAGAIKAHGGTVLVQDPDTAESSLMPRAAMAAAAVDAVLPLDAIGPHLNRLAACRS